MRRARPIVRAVTGITLSKRILVSKLSIPDVTSADFDNPTSFDLVGCAEAQDEDIESTGGTTVGTDVATIPLYSRMTAMRLNCIIQGPSAALVRWMLVKSPDNDVSATSFNTDFHSSNDAQASREIRKNILAKGILTVPGDRLATNWKIFVSRAAWKRASPMRENDRLKLVLAKDAQGTTLDFTCFGTVWVRANG